jgi:uncharacterized membrane protein YsdA (DUF1294 family)
MAGLIIVFSALGGSLGAVITGAIFQHYDGQKAMYFSLVPMAVLVVFLTRFRRLQTSVKNEF